MPRRDHSSAIALVLSLLLHGSLVYVCSEVAGELPAQSDARPVARSRPVHSRILIDSPPSFPPEQAAPKPVEIRTPPPPAPLPHSELTPLQAIKPKPIIPRELAPDQPPPMMPTDGFGELTGAPDATALRSLSGDVPMKARKAEQDQPYISRDPAGISRPADASGKPQPAGTDMPSEEQPAIAEQKPVAGQPKRDPQELRPMPPKAAEMDPTRFGPAVVTTRPSDPPVQLALAQPRGEEVTPQIPQEASTPAETGPHGGQPGSPADSAPRTDSESDPFSVEGSAEFRPGKVTSRFGRKVKTVRPRLSLAGQYDLLSVSIPRVVMRVRADETGRVREVQIIQSSGSQEIDQPCQLAMYDWWFEPPRDGKGAPQPAEMTWTISFRTR